MDGITAEREYDMSKNTTIDKKITMVNVVDISPAAFNPPKRSSTESIRELKASIEDVGIIYPLLVSESMDLIDGHRRLSCAKALNFRTVPCIIVKGESARLFDDVNRTSSKLSKKDNLFVFLSGGPVSKKARVEIDELQKLLDRKDIVYAADNRFSPSGLIFAVKLLKSYLGEKPESFWKKAAKWAMYNGQTYAIRMAITSKMDSKLLSSAIETNSPIN